MRHDEYERMRQVEDTHWRYVALRRLVGDALKQYASSKQGTMLDLGCGTGGFISALGAVNAVGLDRSMDALRFAQGRGGLLLVSGDLGALPFSDNSVRTVLCIDVLYHSGVGNPRHALHEINRVLEPGGIAIVVVPAFAWLRGAHDDVVHGGRRFTPGDLKRLVQDAGLLPVRITCWLSLLLPAVWASRLWSRWKIGAARSDLEILPHAQINLLLGWVMGLERCLLRRVNLPLGTSILCVVRKPQTPLGDR